MNPILPHKHFIPDVEARVWKDGRIYLYGSMDIQGYDDYCSYDYHVFSSSDLLEWKDHGKTFSSHPKDRQISWDEKRHHALFAPDCIFANGKYYLCFCLSDGSEGIAVSENPAGPFKDAWLVKGVEKDGIDPAILLDDDGTLVYYWGQFDARVAKMLPDLSGVDPSTINRSLVNEKEHGFHEGSSIRKRGDWYYLVFADTSRGKATSLGYAMSKSPFGPFEKKGIIIDNDGCDSETWNNHGSICEFQGKWYVFYHRSSHGTKYNRRVCIEPIQFNEDGTINEVEMTTQGQEGPIPASRKMEAWRACLLHGHIRTQTREGNAEKGEETIEYLGKIQRNDWAAYKYLDFDPSLIRFRMNAASKAYGAVVELRLDAPDGELLGSLEVTNTGGWEQWKEFSCVIKPVEGKHALYLVFRGERAHHLSVKDFIFTK